MGRRVVTSVRVTSKEGGTVVLNAGDEVPAWAESQITNPAVYGDGQAEGVLSEYATVEAASAVESDSGAPFGDAAAESVETPDYESMKVAELRDLIAARNAGRPESALIPDDGVKADLVAALTADDAQG